RCENLVEILGIDPVAEEADFECGFRTAAQRALAGIFLQVEEIDPALGAIPQLVAVIAQTEIVENGPDAARIRHFRDIDVLAPHPAPVELQVEPLFAADREFVRFDLDQIPIEIAALHFGADDANAAVPGGFLQLDLGLFLKRLEEELALGRLEYAAP